ncbi:MAG: HD-GYP domain-containing protein [Lachnospiraceae bacterium]|nr:HD-GYP domain-containing protein [Lachnospiraceae bacterium]
MQFIQTHQLNIMLVLSGICGMLALLSLLTESLTKKRRIALFLLGTGSMILLLADRCAYIFRGDTSNLGFIMVRLSNFLVFFLLLFVLFSYSLYLEDVLSVEAGVKDAPKLLLFSKICILIAVVMLVISQFGDFYYYFDENNIYHRANGFILCYSLPLIVMVSHLIIIYTHFRSDRRLLRTTLILFSVIPMITSVLQIMIYGISITNMTLAGLVFVLFTVTVRDLNSMMIKSHKREVKLLKEEQGHIQQMLEQTTSALAEAIDAKDEYTHGHSRRVAEYSDMIAKKLGKTGEECRDIYLAALLHDVGKIGIPDDIINKTDKLSEREFSLIKSHPVIGSNILERITMSPKLRDGALYHHERYDGLGYPNGILGKDIPEVARIIAVADAYDTMTSKRNYRDCLPQKRVREELVKGKGTQFDPEIADVMIKLVDRDTDYTMRQETFHECKMIAVS